MLIVLRWHLYVIIYRYLINCSNALISLLDVVFLVELILLLLQIQLRVFHGSEQNLVNILY